MRFPAQKYEVSVTDDDNDDSNDDEGMSRSLIQLLVDDLLTENDNGKLNGWMMDP